MIIHYELSEIQANKLSAWEKEQDIEWVKSKKLVHPFDSGKPYYGAIDGSLTFELTQTGIGTIIKAKHATGNTIDLTDYDMW